LEIPRINRYNLLSYNERMGIVSAKPKAYIAGLVMCLVFGGSYIAMKIALESVHPLTVVLFRYIIGALLLHLAYYFSKAKEKIKREDLFGLVFLCILEPGLFFIFDAYGLKFTTAVRASILLSIIPILTALAAAAIIKEKLTALKLFTTIGSVAGVLLVMSSKENPVSGSNYILGDLLILGACIAAAFYTTFARRMSFKYSFFTITRFQSLVAIIFFLPLATGEIAIKGLPVPKISSIGGVIYLGIAGSAVGYLLLNYTISRLSAANSAIFANLIPVVTMILSAMILAETIGIRKILGLFIIISFVFILSWGEHRNDLRASKK
jgi:drug/metabolite transporter (DMT)-like permease